MSHHNRSAAALIVIVIAAIPLIAFATDEPSPVNKDAAAVQAVFDQHLDGLRTGDKDKLLRAWHADALVDSPQADAKGVVTLVRSPIARAIDAWAAKPDARTLASVDSIDVIDGKLAMMRISLRHHRIEYREYLTVARFGDTWKILNKTFVAQAAGSSSYGG